MNEGSGNQSCALPVTGCIWCAAIPSGLLTPALLLSLPFRGERMLEQVPLSLSLL